MAHAKIDALIKAAADFERATREAAEVALEMPLDKETDTDVRGVITTAKQVASQIPNFLAGILG